MLSFVTSTPLACSLNHSLASVQAVSTMSNEDTNRLIEDLQVLVLKHATAIMYFMQSLCRHSAKLCSDEEMEVDLDALNPDQQLQLRRFLDGWLVREQPSRGAVGSETTSDCVCDEEADAMSDDDIQPAGNHSPPADNVAAMSGKRAARLLAALSSKTESGAELGHRRKTARTPVYPQTSVAPTLSSSSSSAAGGVQTTSKEAPAVPHLQKGKNGGKAAQLAHYMLQHCVDHPQGMEQVNFAMRRKQFDNGTKAAAVKLVLEQRPDVKFVRQDRIWVLQSDE